MTFDPESDVQLAQEAARAAGAIIMKSFRTEMDVVLKSPDQPVTEADLAADAILKDILWGARPDYGWLSEETADNAARLDKQKVWLVDPIDGTRSFISGLSEFSISIGLADAGRPVVGVVYNPATDELFSAVAGGGAWRDGKRLRAGGDRPRSVLVASRGEIRQGHFEPFKAEFDVRGLGSTAYKLCKVAEGEVDVFMSRGPRSEWDLCGGDVIISEAGGFMSDFGGRALQYNQPLPQITGVVAARADVHAGLLKRFVEFGS